MRLFFSPFLIWHIASFGWHVQHEQTDRQTGNTAWAERQTDRQRQAEREIKDLVFLFELRSLFLLFQTGSSNSVYRSYRPTEASIWLLLKNHLRLRIVLIWVHAHSFCCWRVFYLLLFLRLPSNKTPIKILPLILFFPPLAYVRT